MGAVGGCGLAGRLSADVTNVSIALIATGLVAAGSFSEIHLSRAASSSGARRTLTGVALTAGLPLFLALVIDVLIF